jgi:hypothetical protein
MFREQIYEIILSRCCQQACIVRSADILLTKIKRKENVTYSSVLQKAVFRVVKDGKSRAKRPPFAGQKTAFCKGIYNLLNINRLCLALKIIPQNG